MKRVVGMLGTGVGMAAEYRQHRKEQNASGQNSQDDRPVSAGPSRTTSNVPSSSSPQDLPPSYTEVTNEKTERSVNAGRPATDDKKNAMAQYDDYDDEESSDEEFDSEIEDDEEDWELDEMISRRNSNGPPSYDQSEKDYSNIDELVRDTMAKNRSKSLSPDQSSFVRQPLPCPVIIPQRRPRKKARGFVHAYAPLLGECSGIDQETFISFLDNFYKSSQASPVFGVIQLSAAIAGLAPSVIAMAVTTGVQVAARVGEEMQARQRTNTFLDKMNDELFKPAGLYAMVVKYKSEQEVRESGNSLLARFGVSGETVDLNTNQTIAKYNDSTGMTGRMQNLRLTSASTQGSINLPEAAPLVFPDVDKAIAKSGEESFKDKAVDAKNFLADYLDRRAQMQYARDDPNSALKLPEDKRNFRSAYADPGHPMYQGGILNFASGGLLKQHRGERGGRGNRNSDDEYSRGGRRERHSRGDRRENYGRGARRERRQERRMDKYERRLDDGQELSRKGQRRYDRLQQNYGGRNREFEDSYESRRYEDKSDMRRSFDDRDGSFGGPASDAGYESQPRRKGGRRSRGQRRGGRGGGGGVLGTVKRVMTEDVLYLMIVNMPSEAELAEARKALERAKRDSR